MAGRAQPVACTYEGGGFKIVGDGAWQKRADASYVIGERYLLAPARSLESHAHYFACVAQAHANLPEGYEHIFPSSEHLRKIALIATGFFTIQAHICKSKEDAERRADALHIRDEYAEIKIAGPVMHVIRAKSQAMPEMEGPEFERSKDAVLGYVCDLIGVTVKDLSRLVLEVA